LSGWEFIRHNRDHVEEEHAELGIAKLPADGPLICQ
jgi:hypothetical protein